ncbi:MAG: tRNA uridine-5-carboxymethylaminomethyl(34) synthesis GTPase MnmE [Nitrospira sp.]|nr:tRNA uridine-5-carboxymethylaminomethyl(34) synthesis GTPase MnmE [Candidatus Manganitrophaceae bacterium]HIL35715.1 tRNA uridine-5-carboxymethylaminomethyl(34) synthesis GTPase MnmE [Candidatus Manganitrophaceae bacterium]
MLEVNGENDTICAISTPAGRSAIGIVRVSGTNAFSIVQPLFKRKGRLTDFRTQTVHYSEIQDPHGKEVIDQGIFLVMKGPGSYTGEDLVEIQSHGNPVGLKRILSALVKEGARLAGPGEFTRRAFLSGRMDLAQAEAVMEVISSEGERHYQWALSQLKGTLSDKVNDLRKKLLSSLAEIEASIDFSEDGISSGSQKALLAGFNTINEEVKMLLSGYESGRQIREGFTVVIVGRPNVGKSSLMNALLKEDRAIVTSFPGTTRDLLKEWLVLDGITIRLVDTAGYRETDHPIEVEGVLRAETAEKEADLRIWVLDASEALAKEDKRLDERLKRRKKILVLNKIDLPGILNEKGLEKEASEDPLVKVSTLTGEGIPDLLETIKRSLLPLANKERPLVALVRHRDVLERVHEGLERAIHAAQENNPSEFIAVDLRDAIDALGEVVGETTTEDIMDEIFSKFCIGK